MGKKIILKPKKLSDKEKDQKIANTVKETKEQRLKRVKEQGNRYTTKVTPTGKAIKSKEKNKRSLKEIDNALKSRERGSNED